MPHYPVQLPQCCSEIKTPDMKLRNRLEYARGSTTDMAWPSWTTALKLCSNIFRKLYSCTQCKSHMWWTLDVFSCKARVLKLLMPHHSHLRLSANYIKKNTWRKSIIPQNRTTSSGWCPAWPLMAVALTLIPGCSKFGDSCNSSSHLRQISKIL